MTKIRIKEMKYWITTKSFSMRDSFLSVLLRRSSFVNECSDLVFCH